ncbi:glycosyltransferase [Acetatifactor muris]|uniref:GDP-mannose-dependent alpha-(1-6)-phosphatidylinositol monomannoside mannosyltransferase n=1 Tax=Acetatifactor muris TaxID=879566 RepID=A0A2K4ZD95_9FIRM|nr:glycosyltransferase [Acetatifactor muris]MCR2046970.1 glycosyltransferase [Acetatifactor muris]SOY28439.1 GDP-mannose-dependent alpha-(1-6)-phosphatidylinositol monomannoside mannosyltransferase [Acetatifactor muris]
MIKVCHMTSVHAPEDVRIFKKECVSLAKAGYDTYLVEQGETYDKNGVHIIGVGTQENSRFARMFKMTKRVYEAALKVDADIYHFHDPELLPYGLKLKKEGKKVIFDSHENTAMSIKEKYYIPKLFRNMLYSVYRKYEEYVCNKLDAVIYVTPNLKSDFSRLNKNTVFLPNYPIVDMVNYQEPDRDSFRLVFAGLITPLWSHRNIIEAIDDIDGIEYTLCGNIGEEYLKELKNLAGWEKVNYIGKIPHEQVAMELENSFIGVALMQPHLNSMGYQGTLGNTKIFEEMMAGLPVLCTDFELWKPIVEGNKCGICVNPNNIDQIRDAIRYFVNNRKEAIEMGRRGRELVIKEYNWGVEETDLYLLYGKLTYVGE